MYSGIIYQAISPSGKKYFGQSISSLDERKTGHYKAAFYKKLDYPFYKAIRSYGWDNFEWSIIETCSNSSKIQLIKELDEREKFWIEKERTFIGKYGDEFGYNLTEGGNSIISEFSIEIKKKISKTLRGRNLNEKTKKKISESLLKKKMRRSDETKKKISLANSGKIHSLESRKNMSEAHIGNSYDKRVSYEAISPSGKLYEIIGDREFLNFIDSNNLSFRIIKSFINKGPISIKRKTEKSINTENWEFKKY
ncbi:MAG TPA: GIY-YIG nuclease family protein [Candidatus Paceibacterota bacterium]|nr:GIY-YIG nuclease family protein [Candidatus Paceibacterota bacterium]